MHIDGRLLVCVCVCMCVSVLTRAGGSPSAHDRAVGYGGGECNGCVRCFIHPSCTLVPRSSMFGPDAGKPCEWDDVLCRVLAHLFGIDVRALTASHTRTAG